MINGKIIELLAIFTLYGSVKIPISNENPNFLRAAPLSEFKPVQANKNLIEEKISLKNNIDDVKHEILSTDMFSYQKEYNFKPQEEDIFKTETVVIVMTYKRAHYLKEALDSLLEALPASSKFNSNKLKILISQDGYDEGITAVVNKFSNECSLKGYQVEHYQHPIMPNSEIKTKNFKDFAKLNNNYLKGFQYLLSNYKNVGRIIILEEDLIVSPDFFHYFASLAPILDLDTTLLAVSAWNDNGQKQFVSDNTRVYRTDFFPGLGWMITKNYLEEIMKIWPEAFWDDWLRDKKRRKGRQFLVPEVCRTYHIGVKGGTSGGGSVADRKRLTDIRLNHEKIDFLKFDFTYLLNREYEKYFFNKFFVKSKLTQIGIKDISQWKPDVDQKYLIEYNAKEQFMNIGHKLGIAADIRSDAPRQAYKGVVFLRYRGADVFVAPSKTLQNNARHFYE